MQTALSLSRGAKLPTGVLDEDMRNAEAQGCRMCVPHCAYVRAGLCRCAYPSFGVVEHVPQFPQYDATCARPFCICATTEHSECALHKVTGWAVVSGCSAETFCIRNPS